MISIRSFTAGMAALVLCGAAPVVANAQASAATAPAPVNGAGDCDLVVRGLENVITRRYPDLKFEERSIGDLDGGACQAALSGRGGYLKAWTDPADGVRIILALLPGQGGPMLTYSTPQADAWERRKNDARF